MYTIRSKAEVNKCTLFIEGYIDDVRNLKTELVNEIELIIPRYNNVIVDLSNLLFIPKEGVEVLAIISRRFPLTFIGYSIYIQSLLVKKRILDNSGSESKNV